MFQLKTPVKLSLPNLVDIQIHLYVSVKAVAEFEELLDGMKFKYIYMFQLKL